MLIIIDYDETYTADPVLWDAFISCAKVRMHDIVCCTMRLDDGYNSDVESDMGQHNIPIVYSAAHKDKWEAVQKAGYIPENAVWLDDRPMYIFMNRDYSELE